LNVRNYAGLANLGNSVVAGMTANLNFVTPLPALTVISGDVADVQAAIAKWGPRANRGSHDDLMDLRNKAIILSQNLKSLSQYVMNTAQTLSGSDYPAMAQIITSSGFQLSNPKNPQGLLQPVQNFHRGISPRYNLNQVKLMWKKPLNTQSKNNVKSYRVLKGTTPVFSAASQIAVVTRTRYVDTNTTSTTQTWYYWVVAVNDAGDGATSDVVAANVFSV
jgi:hypothetical protein